MPDNVEFHFLILAIGEYLRYNKEVTSQNIQDLIQKDESFGVRVPLGLCRLALELTEGAGFISSVEGQEGVYTKAC